ncbi:AraC-type DNA-binding protein [Paenibacillus sp. RU4T]|uniref:AraC family transcriptional regulator n=1 Tax=unclassified Paenibacillus TaxID=185978 RepID=UPI0009556AF3|nr:MULTISPECIES: AraC family transcriptional regulator [unclassified Paenibacillus]SIR64583.1 AraC-type DNA-binding protein [Paenibacillus sp. RU4X]SIR72546.1 AraC-type DNA-binding protein [Paenibacillus sp. RU4T]
MDKPMNLILQTRLRQMQVIYAMAARSEWKPGSVIENSSQGHHCLALPITGSVSLNASDGHFQAGPGRMYCIPPGSKHTYTVDKGGPFRCYWVRFELDAGSTEFFKSLQLPLSAAVDEPDQLEARYRRLISLSGNITDELRARAIIMELVAAYLQRGLEGHSSASVATELSLFSEILDYIERHPADNLSVDDLARQMYLHPNYFISLFRSFTGCTPIQYVNQRKMEHARRLLDESALPVRDIAGEVGLTGPYFSRMFKQLIGTSPRRYRQLMEETRMLRMEKPGEDNHMGSSIKMENPGEDNQADSSIKMENPGEGNQAGSSIKMENPGGDNQAGCSIKMENPGEDNHMGCSIKMENPGEDNHMGCSIKKGNPDSSSVPGCFPPLNEEFGWLEEAVGCGRTAAIYSIVQRKSGNSFK